jgi:2-polyprenyl-3-methyl-5-hydroxy-6-metoxy-1,4-benzoquinol methylase
MSFDKLKNVEAHFAFGKNWASYARLIDDHLIAEAKKGLLKLVPAEEFNGRSFFDIGCGSGLHALAAAQLGVSRILAIDIDSDSVATSIALLSSKNVTTPWQVELTSVFDLDAAHQGSFDIVYSWGVLHHTGSMWEAISKAASMVASHGLLVIALYRKTRMDPFWKLEKRLYSHAPNTIQRVMRAVFIAIVWLAKFTTGKSFHDYVANYRSSRGMDFFHDLHDWLGGYPYETALASEVEAKLAGLGFKPERVFVRPGGGIGCDEYVYRARR